jgi:cytochrome c553
MRTIASLAALALICSGASTAALSQARIPAQVASPTQAPMPDPPLDSIAQRARPCTACHGEQGRATPEGYFPRIAGKPAGYLFNQLTGFRDGRRFFPEMTFLVERQRDDYLRALADYFANVELPYAGPVQAQATPAALERGRELVMNGDASRSIPACKSCHGEQLMGVLPATPALLGLSPDYLIAQLGGWANGTRHALQPDCMANIIKGLSSNDIHAVTAWLAAQQVPANAHPQAAFNEPPPVQCGSIEATRR